MRDYVNASRSLADDIKEFKAYIGRIRLSLKKIERRINTRRLRLDALRDKNYLL